MNIKILTSTETYRYNETPTYTTSNGCPVRTSTSIQYTKPNDIQVFDPESSQRIGKNGPLLLQDFHLIDLLAHFDRERIPERVVHAKGAGAYGEFEVTDDISDIVSLPTKRFHNHANGNRPQSTCSKASVKRLSS